MSGEKDKRPGRLELGDLLRETELYDNPLTEKQRSILEAAERLFSQAGYAETPTAAIAREAGVTEKTLFKHFPTKLDLFRRVLFPILARTIVPLQFAKVRQVMARDYADYAASFTALAQDRWRLARELGPKLRFALSQMMTNDPIRREMARLFHENPWRDMVDAVERMQAAGKVRRDVPAATIARLQLTVIAGYAAFRAAAGADYALDEEREAVTFATLLSEGMRPR